MISGNTKKPSLSKVFQLTRRDLQLFGLSAILFGGIAFGAVTMVTPGHGQMANTAGICSSAKFFR